MKKVLLKLFKAWAIVAGIAAVTVQLHELPGWLLLLIIFPIAVAAVATFRGMLAETREES